MSEIELDQEALEKALQVVSHPPFTDYLPTAIRALPLPTDNEPTP